jgi:hypothetical protein
VIKLLIRIVLSGVFLLSGVVHARETIVVISALSPAHSGNAHTMALVETANKIQNRFRFVQEFRVGGFESIALRQVLTDPQKYLSVNTNTVAEAVDRKFVDINNFVPVFAQGDFCWMAVALVGPKGQQLSDIGQLKEIVVGTPALGGATHLLALEIGKKYNVPVQYVLFHSNFEAFVNMVSNNGVTFVVERVSNFNQYKDKNPNMRMIGALCQERHPLVPGVKTVREQGIDTPLVWQTIFASKLMDAKRRQDISDIFSQAERQIGQQEIFKISDQTPPLFHGISSEQHFRESWKKLNQSRDRWRNSIGEK